MLLLRKLFQKLQAFDWKFVILELIIVFIGVYLAFYLNSYQTNLDIAKESEKVYSSLKVELEQIRFMFPGRAVYQRERIAEWDSLQKIKKYELFYDWRFIQPQYDFTTLEYALNLNENTIIDFELYDILTNLYQRIQQLEHAERLITDVALNFQSIPVDSDMNSERIQLRFADNRLNFFRFVKFSRSRADGLEEIAKLTTPCLKIIDQKLSLEKKQMIELDLVVKSLDIVDPDRTDPPKRTLMAIKHQFPNLPAQEIQKIIDQYYKE